MSGRINSALAKIGNKELFPAYRIAREKLHKHYVAFGSQHR